MYVLLGILAVTASFFTIRYFTIVFALRQVNKDLQDIQKNLAQNQILRLPVPHKELKNTLRIFNNILEEIRKERQESEKREKEFQKQIENVSHDLRTPLTVILGYLKLIRKNIHPFDLHKELAEALQIIEQKADAMKNLVTQFYDFSRINAGDYSLALDSIDISRILRESLMGNYQVLEQSHLEIQANIPEHPIWVLGQVTALERVFLNLLQNAGRYADSFLHIAVIEEELNTSVLFINDTHKLTRADIPQLFGRFYMQSGSRNQGGTGLGLTVAKSLAEEMEGTLEADIIEYEALQPDSGNIALCFKLGMKHV